MSSTPLAGLRILDLTTTVSGPVCTERLAQYGAEVIKIETASGDVMRTLGGPSRSGRHGAQYLHFNRGKKSVVLDLKSNAGRAALEAILSTCDALVSNMRLEALDRLGLSAAQVRARHPHIVHLVITGYGPGGPYSGLPAYDSVVQGASGTAGLALHRDGAPAFFPILIADHFTGEIAAGALIAALVERGRTGTGASVEVPMLETVAAFVLQQHLGRATFDPPLGPPGDTRALRPGTRPVQTADGWITLTYNTDEQVLRFLGVIERPDLLDDPRFASVALRLTNLADWQAIRDAALIQKPTDYWLAAFHAADIPAMPCHDLDSLITDPHLTAVGLLQPDTHPLEGQIRAVRSSVLFDGETAPVGRAASDIGADTGSVLSSLT